MLSTMRTHQKKIMMWLVAPIILVFVLYYGGSGKNRDLKKQRDEEAKDYIAKVNDVVITRAEYRKAYGNAIENMRSSYKDKWDESMIDRYDIPKNILERLINEEILFQASKKAKMTVSDAEVAAYIQNLVLQGREETVGDYLKRLAANGNDVNEIFEKDRREVAVMKMQELIQSTATVSEEELQTAFKNREEKCSGDFLAFEPKTYLTQVPEPNPENLSNFFNENKPQFRVPDKVKVRYARLIPADFEKLTEISPEAVKRYYEEHGEEYKSPEKVQVEQIAFLPEKYGSQVSLKEEEIKQYYDQNKAKYMTQPQARVRYAALNFQQLMESINPTEDELRQYYEERNKTYVSEESKKVRMIFLRMPDASTGQEKAQKRELAKKIKQELNQGIPFEDAARKYSEDDHKNDGGLVGYRTYSELMSLGGDVADQAFGLEAGKSSDPFPVKEGMAIVKVDEVKPGGAIRPFEDVREQATKDWKYEKAQKAANDKFQALKTALGNQIDPAKVPAEFLVRETKLFERGAQVDEVVGDDARNFTNAPFRQNIGQIGEVVQARQNWYIMELLEKLDPREMTLDEAREKVSADKTKEAAMVIAKQEAEKAYADIQAGKSFDAAAAERGIQIQDTGLLTKDQKVPGIGWNAKEYQEAAFQMKEGEVSKVVPSTAGHHILRFIAREEAVVPELNSGIENNIQAVLRKKRSTEEARAFGEAVLLAAADETVGLATGFYRERNNLLANSRLLDATDKKDSNLAKLDFLETSFFGENDSPEPLGQAPEFVQAAFKLKKPGDKPNGLVVRSAMNRQQQQQQQQQDEISDFFIMTLLEKRDAHDPELAEVSKEVQDAFKEAEAAKLAKAEGEAAYAKLEPWASAKRAVSSATDAVKLSDFAKEFRYPIQKAPSFGRGDQIAQVGQCPALAAAVFNAEPGKYTPLVEATLPLFKEGKEVGRKNMGYFVFQVWEHTKPDMTKYQSTERQAILTSMLRERSTASLQDWLKTHRDTLKEEKKLEQKDPDEL